MVRCVGLVLLWLAFAGIGPVVALAGVAVEEDEVIFSLVATGSSEVFLVGDFNNWNPTLEKMDLVDGRFEVRLFLFPGRYRYKFVVDGNWINDPDNPPADPKAGSSIVLEARGGALAFGEAPAEERGAEAKLRPSARYQGLLSLENGDTESTHALDVFMSYANNRVRALADVRTVSEAWDLSEGKGRIDFDRGYLELGMGEGRLTGFENDTIWTSRDPFRLVGNVGPYDYNAGYGRHGFSLETPELLKTTVRALFADNRDRRTEVEAVPESALGEAGILGAADTTRYDVGEDAGGADSWALDLVTDAGSLVFGYGMRKNRGLHRGALVEAYGEPSNLDLRVSQTTEHWDASVFWLRWRIREGLGVMGAYGTADADIRTGRYFVPSDTVFGKVHFDAGAVEGNREIALQRSRRWYGELAQSYDRFAGTLAYSWNRFEFEPLFAPGASSTIYNALLGLRLTGEPWQARVQLRYTDQRYGEAPDAFHYGTPARNFWLDRRNRLGLVEMLGFDVERYADVEVTFNWRGAQATSRLGIPAPGPLAFRVTAQAAGKSFFESLDYAALRVAAERRLVKYVYGSLDVRGVRYDKASWNLRQSYFSAYAEIGYRRARYALSIGLGFDPVILDRVTNDYLDIGRTELLRAALPESPRRTQGSAIGVGLREQEERLKDLQSLLSLEVVFLF